MSDETIRRLAALSADHLSRALDPSGLAARFAADLAAAGTGPLPPGRPVRAPVRGLAHLPAARAEATRPDEHAALASAALAAAGAVNWSEFYAEDAWSYAFLPGFANGEGIGPDGAWHHSSVILGLFILGPGLVYPAHAHPAEEFYIPLNDAAAFEVGAGAGYIPRRRGEVVLHAANVSHSIRTNDRPLLAVFGWRGEIGARSWYRDDMTDESLSVRHPTIAKSA